MTENNDLIINISGLNKIQKINILRFLRRCEILGKIGGSQWIAFYADGDGGFHPEISIAAMNKELWNKGVTPLKYGNYAEEEITSGYFIDCDEE